jgi:fatty-acyl-CoA synthase
MAREGGFGMDGPDFTAPDLDEDAPWYLLFTSGTTGLPKAVIQTPRMAMANAVNIAQFLGLSAADRSVCFLPLFHTAGINLYHPAGVPLGRAQPCAAEIRRPTTSST